jgi:hypothetical protein
MGHASSSYLLQVSEYAGTYSNPFKPNGKGMRFTKWKTVDGRSEGIGGIKGAKEMWLEHFRQRDPAKLTKFRVQYRGKTVISHQGRVYEQRGDGMYFVEDLLGS